MIQYKGYILGKKGISLSSAADLDLSDQLMITKT